MEVVLALVIFILGMVCGIVGTLITRKPKTKGTLRIYSDPDDGPYLFVELKTSPEEIMRDKTVLFDVNPKDYISQK